MAWRTLLVAVAAFLAAAPAPMPAATPSPRGLEVYWIDVEGGAATLIVTPAGESVLIDAGFPGERDAGRIHHVATKVARLTLIDHLVVTHFHRDHFGGVADLARLMPVAVLLERDLAKAPERERALPEIAGYRAAAVGRRATLAAGERLPPRQARGAETVFLEVLGSDGSFATPKKAKDNAARCRDRQPQDADASDNRNSVVLRLGLGPFRLFDGGDLTWNTEADLVCPRDHVGRVDVFQADHHGFDNSNNPVLVRTLAPTVAVVNNGPRKGNEPRTAALLRDTPSIEAVYQVHRDVRDEARNTAQERIANAEESCSGEYVMLSVEPHGRTYTVSVPSTGHRATYKTRR
jgi:beta-lactamase superfamily II metal-dependent hydrolase